MEACHSSNVSRSRTDHSRNASSWTRPDTPGDSASLGRADGVPLGQRALGRSSRPRAARGPSWSSARGSRATPAAGRRRSPAGTGMPTIAPALLAGLLLHPAGELGADAAAPVVGVDGGVAAVGDPGDLGVRHQAVAVEDADGVGRDVVAGPLPVGDDVGLLDHRPRRRRRAPGRRSRAVTAAASAGVEGVGVAVGQAGAVQAWTTLDSVAARRATRIRRMPPNYPK